MTSHPPWMCPGNPANARRPPISSRVADLSLRGGAGGLLFTLGTLRRGELWESTAIPELRTQARAVATRLVDSLSLPSAAEAIV